MRVSKTVRTAGDLRANQKERTREALIAAARELVRTGGPPTVAEAAEAARVSRATAYRYFPTQDSLLVEVTRIDPAVEPVERLLAGMSGDDAEERLVELVDAFSGIVFREEVAMRTALRSYQDTWLRSRARGEPAPPLREGRRLRWLDTALAPVRRELTDAQWRRLRAALALAVGTEALVVMKDVCRIEDDRQALDVLRWAATTLLRAGLSDALAAKRRRARSR